MKRIITAALAVAIVLGMLGGCKEKNVSEEGKMKISWLGVPYYPENEDGCYTEKLLEKKFNVEITPVYMDDEAYKTKKAISMSSGEIPDIIYELDPLNVQSDARQGFLLDVDYDKIKQSAPAVFEQINKEVPKAWLYSHYDGKNYGVPNIYYTGNRTTLGLWRADWLKNVGIDKVPETIDEMHEAFVRFRNNDPDGNGKQDTYGMSADMVANHFTMTEIFGAFGALPFNWVNDGGKIVYGGLMPEIKKALEVIAKWYSEGLIDPDFITDDTVKNIQTKFKNGSLGYINAYGQDYLNTDESKSDSMIGVMKQINPDAEVAVAKLPVGPDGKSGVFAWGKGGHIISFGRQLKDDTKKLDKIFEMLDYMQNNEDFSIQMLIGKEGEHYKMSDSSDGGIEFIPPYDNVTYRKKYFAVGSLNSTSFFNIVPPTMDARSKYENKKSIEHDKKYIDETKARNDAFLKPDVVPESDKYFRDLKNKQIVLMTAIIRGEKSADDYDEFEKIWQTLGGKELTENANNLQTKMNDILGKVGVK